MPSPAQRILNHLNGTSEATRDTLMAVAAIHARAWDADQQLDQAIRAAKDLGAEQDPPLEIVPVYERPGWWTSDPTEYIRLRADVEALRRNVSEQDRLARCHPAAAFGTPILAASAMSCQAALDMLLAALRTLTPEHDPVLERIDAKLEQAA